MAKQPKDNFSEQASAYAAFRPHYPQQLYDFLYSLPMQRDTAWDCGTGNGQVASELAKAFKLVYATDISEAQLQHAPQRQNIRYLTCPAESSPLQSHSIDLLTVAQAVHWFDFKRFTNEAERVLKPGGWIALWGYGLVQAADQQLNPLIKYFYTHTVGPYWDQERKHIDNKYEPVPFPFAEIKTPDFSIPVNWTRADLLGYLSSWSSVQHFNRHNLFSPLPEFENKLQVYWPSEEKKEFNFPVFLRVGQAK
ncbi:class I SAM-dependent methyltransferase [Pontibacter korlensis]|uniref:SAM-dependent methyltransferase n=1 Tax=Pontibacter korlensis TaxID=400092 RepID=A0A0E3ZG67_9BACT|nr:class I SAM-dependent methyltransferase [Pontibacter korlensis]AKD04713.1 SAM-dependent methyltransferase [Pontibacter korlensis]